MQWIRAVLRELLGLFIEDGRFAATILIWLGAAKLALPRLGMPRRWQGAILFGGLGLILAESVLRYSRRRR